MSDDRPANPGGPRVAPTFPTFPKTIERFLARAERLFLWAACASTAAMLALNIANLITRNLIGRGIVWVWAWTGVLFVWSVFLGFYVLYRRRLDVTLDYFIERFPRRLRTAVRILVSVCGILMLGVIVLQTGQVFQRQVGVIDFVGLHRYVLSIPLLASSALIMLHFANDIVLALTCGDEDLQRDQALPKWSL